MVLLVGETGILQTRVWGKSLLHKGGGGTCTNLCPSGRHGETVHNIWVKTLGVLNSKFRMCV